MEEAGERFAARLRALCDSGEEEEEEAKDADNNNDGEEEEEEEEEGEEDVNGADIVSCHRPLFLSLLVSALASFSVVFRTRGLLGRSARILFVLVCFSEVVV